MLSGFSPLHASDTSVTFGARISVSLHLTIVLVTLVNFVCRAFGRGVCLFDATMGATVKYGHALYVFSVLDENRSAIPVLYLITNALTHLPVFVAIQWLRRQQPGFDPCAWMMDDSAAQQKAISLLYQRGLIRYCTFRQCFGVLHFANVSVCTFRQCFGVYFCVPPYSPVLPMLRCVTFGELQF